jgi:hypothetical protein
VNRFAKRALARHNTVNEKSQAVSLAREKSISPLTAGYRATDSLSAICLSKS